MNLLKLSTLRLPRRPAVLVPVLLVLAALIFLLAPRATLQAAGAREAQGGEGQKLYLPLVLSSYVTPNPLTVQVTLDESHRTQATVPLAGGELSVTAADGTRFTLTLSERSLLVTETITMTVVSGIEGMVFSGGLAAAVHLEPKGLQLYDPAILTIEPATSIPPEQQTFFAYYGDGEEFHQHPVLLDTSRIAMPVYHFSGYGVARATDAERATQQQHLPTSREDQLRQQISELVRQEREAQLRGEPGDPELWNKLQDLFRQWFRDVVTPKMQSAARGGCEGEAGQQQVADALSSAFGWERTIQLLGFGDDFMTTERAGIWDFLEQMLRNCWEDATQPCIDWEDAAQVRRVLAIARMAALLGLEGFDPWAEPECGSCGWVQDVEEWSATITFSYAQEGGNSEKHISISHSGDVTMNATTAFSNTNHTRWDDTSISGTGEIDDEHRRYRDEGPDDVQTNVGQGAVLPSGPTPEQPGGSIGFFADTCMMEFYLKTGLPTVYTAYGESNNRNSALGLMDVNDIPVPDSRGAISGSRQVATVWLVEFDPQPHWFSPGTGWVDELKDIVGQLNPTTITWEITPVR